MRIAISLEIAQRGRRVPSASGGTKGVIEGDHPIVSSFNPVPCCSVIIVSGSDIVLAEVIDTLLSFCMFILTGFCTGT